MALALREEAAGVSAAQVIAALEAARYLPEAALRQAVDRASEIAPAVIEVVEQAARGVYLLPLQENLLVWGIHAVAAGRRTELYQPLMRLLHQSSEDQLERLFGDCITETMEKVVIAVFDGDHVPLVDACSDDRLDGSLRWPLMQALARLTFDGKIARSTTLDFMNRFARESLAAPDDAAWEGWQDVIALLGLEEMREHLYATRADGRNQSDPRDYDDIERELSIACALAPGDPAMFENRRIAALSDPVKTLSWMARREPDRDRGDDDPAGGIALDDLEIWWLAGFLRSDKVPPGAMTFEQVDGFFCALIAGPIGAQFADCMRAIWNEDDTRNDQPSYDSAEQAQYVDALLRRHWTAIGLQLERSHPHDLILTDGTGADKGRYWARGFLYGMFVNETTWNSRLGERTIETFVEVLLSLGIPTAESEAQGLTPQLPAEILDILPRRLVAVHHAWRGRPDPFPPIIHRGSGRGKIGRNERCPCGSGKKYKRCCGSA